MPKEQSINTTPILERQELLIERPAVVNDFDLLLKSGKRLFLIDTEATYGSGKTTILSQLFWHIEKDDSYRPVWLSLNLSGLDKSSYFVLRDLLENILGCIDTDLKNKFINCIQKHEGILQVESGDVWVGGEIKDSIVTTANTVNEKHTETLVETLTSEMADEFKKLFKKASNEKTTIFLVDNFCYIIGTRVGGWFLDILEDLENVILVIARTLTKESLPIENRMVTSFNTIRFSRDEVTSYLKKRLRIHEGLEHLTDCIYQFSHDGHPGTVCLAADSIQKDELKDISGIIEFFEKAAEELVEGDPHRSVLEQKYDAMIEEILCDIREKDRSLEPILHCATILRYYTQETLRDILQMAQEEAAESDLAELVLPDEEQFNKAVERLNRFSFVERLAKEKNGFPVFAFQNFVRTRIETRMKKYSPQLHKILNSYACDYYRSALDSDIESGTKKAYTRNYVLENEGWQEITTEWLYHLSIIKERSTARLKFAGAYFEAFNWWNWVLPFQYCIQLRKLWRSVQKDELDARLLRLLEDLEASYPKGYTHEGEGNWVKTRIALANIRNLLELDGSIEKLTSEARTTLGFIEWFTAESYTYSTPPSFDKAEACYLKTQQIFELEEDIWNQIWNDEYMAALYLRMGRPADARLKAGACLEKATGEEFEEFADQDHEVMSLDYLVFGDAYWAEEDLPQAFRDYARAAFHSCIFNVTPEEQDPDEITAALYAHIRRQATGRIIDLHAGGNAVSAQQAVDYLIQFWSVYWQLAGIQPDREAALAAVAREDRNLAADLLFPRQPKTQNDIDLLRALAYEMYGDVDRAAPAPVSK